MLHHEPDGTVTLPVIVDPDSVPGVPVQVTPAAKALFEYTAPPATATTAATMTATIVFRISPCPPLLVRQRIFPPRRGDWNRSEWRSGDRELRVFDAAVDFEHFARYPRGRGRRQV